MSLPKPIGSGSYWSKTIADANRSGCDAYQQAYFQHLAGAGPEPQPFAYGVPTLEASRLREEAKRQRAEEDRQHAANQRTAPAP